MNDDHRCSKNYHNTMYVQVATEAERNKICTKQKLCLLQKKIISHRNHSQTQKMPNRCSILNHREWFYGGSIW
jgi:hypothetical protein